MKKILVVDDERRIRMIYADVLTVNGYETVEAANVAQANEILKREVVDLVLLDLRIPEIHGNILYEVMQLFHTKTKVIVSSVYPVDKQKRIIAGAADYYDKSQGVDALLDKVAGVFKKACVPSGVQVL